jgi:hypothetical protein
VLVLIGAVAVVILGPARADAAKGVEVVDQSTEVTNSGDATANTGGNVAIGNASVNTAVNEQEAEGGGVATNIADASNSSNGTATIVTGDATATGVASETTVEQAVAGGGDGGLAIVDQSTEVENDGDAVANTGDTVAIGNASTNTVLNDQDADAGGIGVAANIADVRNVSDGSASITTGDASATGVDATVDVGQTAIGSGADLVLADQDLDVDNDGDALANSGLNVSLGNVSDNLAVNEQEVETGGGADVVNIIDLANSSDGLGAVITGDAQAWGTITDIATRQTLA